MNARQRRIRKRLIERSYNMAAIHAEFWKESRNDFIRCIDVSSLIGEDVTIASYQQAKANKELDWVEKELGEMIMGKELWQVVKKA